MPSCFVAVPHHSFRIFSHKPRHPHFRETTSLSRGGGGPAKRGGAGAGARRGGPDWGGLGTPFRARFFLFFFNRRLPPAGCPTPRVEKRRRIHCGKNRFFSTAHESRGGGGGPLFVSILALCWGGANAPRRRAGGGFRRGADLGPPPLGGAAWRGGKKKQIFSALPRGPFGFGFFGGARQICEGDDFPFARFC